MTPVSESAPGKLFVCGEYAVLRNAPAIVMAVDRRAIVNITPIDAASHVVTTPGYSEHTYRFESPDGNELTWLDDSSTTPPGITAAVVQQTGLDASTPIHIEIDTRSFVDAAGAKFGLGSSAAASVALTRALLGRSASETEIWTHARRAHDTLQGGSGADVAASCFGGVLVYQRESTALPTRVDWPEGLDFRVLFSGRAASTPDAIDKASSNRLPDSAWDSLISVAATVADAWRGGEAQHVLAALADYRDELQDFDRAGVESIFSAGHAELSDLGGEYDVVYKPSGAGGGDCGIAFSTDTGRLDRFAQAATEQDFVTLDIQRDNTGA